MIPRFLGLVAVLSVAVSRLSADTPSSEELQQRAAAAFQLGDYEAAAPLYKKVAETEPEEAMWAFWNMGRVDLARPLAESILHSSPDDPEAKKILEWSAVAIHRDEIRSLHKKAKAAYRARRNAEAIEDYNRIVQLDPGNVLFARDRMWLLYNSKRYSDARAAAENVLLLHPDDSEAETVVEKCDSVVSIPLGASPDELISGLRAKSARHPERRSLRRRLAWALYNEGRYQEAKEVLSDLLETSTDSSDVWYLLGRTQMALKDFDDANFSLQRSLALNPDQPRVNAALGRSYIGLRDLKKGISYLDKAVNAKTDARKNALPALAKALFYDGEYQRSAETWSAAAAAYDDKSEYRFREAEARYYAGDQIGALIRMWALHKERQEPLALKFLIDNAIARRDYAVAAGLLEKSTVALSVQNARDVLRLSSLYSRLNEPEKNLALLQRWIRLFPTDIPALLAIASVHRDLNQPREAERAYERVLTLNSSIIEADLGLSDCQFINGKSTEGLLSLRKAHDLEPGNPYVLRHLARALADHDFPDEAHALLLTWLDQNADAPVLPILLFHGLTPIEGAPMLAYPEHMTVNSFEDQMKALSEGGYHAVSISQVADWYAGTGALPAKPVFITFDDARIDGFTNADPILEKYSLKATMFVPLDNVETSAAIGFAPWEIIERFQRTGRWDIQSHGATAHSKIVVDAEGRESLSMLMPKWLPAEKRSETEAEWRERVDQDHETSRRVIEQRLGKAPIGFAYAEGLYGQRSDAAVAVPLNVAAAKKYFTLAFVQDDYGLNVHSENPLFLRRVEPQNDWSGDALVNHITDRSPILYAYRDMIYIALRQQHFSEADEWLARLKAVGGSEQLVTAEGARIAYASGDYIAARKLVRQALALGEDPSLEALLAKLQARSHIAWRPGASFEKDSQGRQNWDVHQEFELPLSAIYSAVLSQSYEEFSERAHESVEDLSASAGARASWNERHEAQGSLVYHALSGGARDFLGYAANYRFRPNERFTVRGETRRRPYGSARALNENIRETLYRVDSQVGQGDWGLFVRGRLSELTNDNERRSLDGEFRWALDPAGVVGPVVRLGYDDMKRQDDRYYSPRRLRTNAFGLQVSARPSPALKFVLRYLPGSAKEQGTRAQFAQSLTGRLRWAVGKQTSIEPSLSYQQTSHYHDSSAGIDLEHRF